MGEGGTVARGRRALAAHPHRTAAVAMGLLVFAYLWPVLIGGDVLSPASLLYELHPWTGSIPVPQDIHSYFNEDLVDVPMAIYPWRFFARAMLHHGTFPAWNPHVFAGAPFFSNPANGLFSPFSLPLWILSLNYGIGVGAALKLWAAGFGCHLLARELRLGLLPGLLAGVGFAFSALNIVWLTHESLPAVAAMFPWMVWLVERIFRGGRLGSAVGLALVTAAAIGGGHAGMQVHVLAATGVYVLLRAAPWNEGGREERLRALAYAAGGLVVGTLAMAVILVPEVLSSRGTIGTAARHGGHGTLPGSVLPLETIKTAVFPDWWGRPSAFETMGPANFNERTFYAGTVTFLLACTGLLARGGWRRKGPFLLFAVLGLAIPLHAPVLYWLTTNLPVLADVQSQRLLFLYGFGAAMLAAYGLQAVLDRPDRGRWLAVPLGALALSAIALALALALAGGDLSHVARHFLTGADVHSAAGLAAITIIWFALFTLAVGAALLAVRRRPHLRLPAAMAIVLLAALDMLHFAHGFQPMGPPSRVFPPRTPAIAFLQRHAHDGRIVARATVLAYEWSGTYGLDDVRGYEPPQPTVRFYNLWKAAEPEQTNWQPFGVNAITPLTLRLVSLLGARWLLDVADARTISAPGMWTPDARYSGRDGTVFENPNALARAMVATHVAQTSEERQTVAALLAPELDIHSTVVVERDQPGVAALAQTAPVHGTAAVTGQTNASVTVRATLDRRGLVLLDDNLADGWSVRVDGRPARAVRADDVLRGVVVGPGRHEIRWSYSVPGLRAGAAVSLVALTALAGAAIVLVRRRRVPLR
ncbi:MAG: hypothetical protein ACTHOE_15175 [Conexibacter sp.]